MRERKTGRKTPALLKIEAVLAGIYPPSSRKQVGTGGQF
jgi:hypothetical protein